ncbi:alcohol dehydrogenase AdhP [Acinetobacter populi]|uniref:alcohol dehydrogenase n=1 Tax=Acinetobacter populi TaxID=1582270 RepID=A0A1Z9Z1F0_9GAMM|nr:alcohol dehydrogenase AdhP [Acinetobacter populi]OUY08311.1 alcohol dehydrogenase AdhP [Acinetobacter populi]
MGSMMKAAVVTAFNQPLEIKEVEIPKVSAGKVLVKVFATGVCHTDLHAMHGDWPIKPSVPFIPGHEGVGEVVEIGEGITHLKVGDTVGIPWLYSACGHCDHCYAGWETLCKEQQNSGYSVNGSFAEYCLADGEYVGVIPEGVDLLEIAPILCAGVTVYKGLKMTEAKTGDWVAISGIGGLGHVAVQYAKTMGFNVVAIDVDDSKLDLAKELGADVGINAIKQDVAEEVKKATGDGCHGVLVTAVSPKAFEQAVKIVRRGGTMVLNGLPPGKFDLSIFDMVLDGITVRGSIVGTRLDLKEALDIAARGKVKAHISVEPLENINDIFERMEAGKIDGRIVIDLKL